LLLKKIRDGKREISEKHSHHSINLLHNGTQLQLLLNGVKPTLMLCQLPQEPLLIKPLKQVNLHNRISHLPLFVNKTQKKVKKKNQNQLLSILTNNKD